MLLQTVEDYLKYLLEYSVQDQVVLSARCCQLIPLAQHPVLYMFGPCVMLLLPVDQSQQISAMLSGPQELQRAILSPCKNNIKLTHVLFKLINSSIRKLSVKKTVISTFIEKLIWSR
jgi:hypothetical protein